MYLCVWNYILLGFKWFEEHSINILFLLKLVGYCGFNFHYMTIVIKLTSCVYSMGMLHELKVEVVDGVKDFLVKTITSFV